MHSNVVRGLLRTWTTAAHALFSIIFQTFTAERRAFQWRENEFCSHLQSGKWRIEIHVKKEMCGVHKFPNFLWPVNYLGTQHQSWRKRQFKMKKTVKKTAFFTGQSHSFSFFACPSHSCELQTQLPQNEAPKQTTSSLDRSGHELSREPFIRAVRV